MRQLIFTIPKKTQAKIQRHIQKRIMNERARGIAIVVDEDLQNDLAMRMAIVMKKIERGIIRPGFMPYSMN